MTTQTDSVTNTEMLLIFLEIMLGKIWYLIFWQWSFHNEANIATKYLMFILFYQLVNYILTISYESCINNVFVLQDEAKIYGVLLFHDLTTAPHLPTPQPNKFPEIVYTNFDNYSNVNTKAISVDGQ